MKNKAGEAAKPFNKPKYRRFKEEMKPEIFFYKCDVPIRTEELPPFAKAMQSKVVERKFEKDSSVFQKWRADTTASVTQALNKDLAMWKGTRFIKSDEEVSKNINPY